MIIVIVEGEDKEYRHTKIDPKDRRRRGQPTAALSPHHYFCRSVSVISILRTSVVIISGFFLDCLQRPHLCKKMTEKHKIIHTLLNSKIK